MGNNGIISKAKEARDKYAEAEANDQAALDELSSWLSGQLGDGENNEDDKVKLDKNLPSGTGTTPYFPDNDFSHVVGTDLSNGIVIQDSQENQYVWVEVPRTTDVYTEAGLNLDLDTLTGEELDNAYEQIKNDLHTYTSDYRDGTDDTDIYSEDSTKGWFADANAYNTAKNKMLKSVYQNGGFWIGRYEAGDENQRTIPFSNKTTPLSKKNLYPYTLASRTEAKVLAEQVLENNPNYTSSLMFGVQWDLVLKYIEIKEVAKPENEEIALTTIQSELRSDSTSWGNYYDSTFTLNRGKYAKCGELNSPWKVYTEDLDGCVAKSVKQSASSVSNGILLTTGASDATRKMNIYDIAGNVSEFTLENAGSTRYVSRGGTYRNSGAASPASARIRTNRGLAYDCIGFRVSLY